MRQLVILFLFVGVVHLTSCSILEQAQETQRFVQCDFSLANIEVIEVGGLNIQNLQNPEEIGFLSMMSLTQQVINGSLPVNLNIGIRAKNNNVAAASITGMDWKLLLNNEDFLGGVLDKVVKIQPNSSSVFPVNVNLDLFTIFKSQNLQQLLNFAFSDNKAQELKNMGVGVKIKPHYLVGSEVQKLPAWLSIQL